MNTYCLSTNDRIDLFKIKDLNKLLYKYAPYINNGKSNIELQIIIIKAIISTMAELHESWN